jgi:hypothetical protein
MATVDDECKIKEAFDVYKEFQLLKFKVPMVCLVTGCVSRRRDGRY